MAGNDLLNEPAKHIYIQSVRKNLSHLKGLNAEERCFAWKVTQDMLAVGTRNNAEKRCLTVLETGSCEAEQTLVHCMLMMVC